MKKIMKITLIFCAITLAIGTILVAIGIREGGVFYTYSFHPYDPVSKTEEYGADEIKSIQLDISAAKVNIKRGNQFLVEAERINKEWFTSEVKENTLVISHKIKSEKDGFNISMDLFGFNWWDDDKDRPEITIYLPEDFIAESLLIDMKAGECNLNDFTSNTATIDVKAGTVSGSNVTIQNKSTLDVKAGEIEFRQFYGKNVAGDVKAGGISLDGKIEGNSSFDTKGGSIELDLDCQENEYDYYIDVAAGNVEINGDDYYSDENITGNNQNNQLNLSCSAGSIEVETN